MREYGMEQLGSGSYPNLTALADDPAVASIADEARSNERFERGLRALLDGATRDQAPAHRRPTSRRHSSP